MAAPVILKRRLFFNIMAECNLFGISTIDSQIEHFMIYGGAYKLPSPNTIKNWTDTERHIKTKRYFGSILTFNHVLLFKHIRVHDDDTLLKIQNQLKPYKDFFGLVDTETTDLDLFCRSIVNQFAKFVDMYIPDWKLHNDD